ncbi:MAG: NUDIX domain-containing protein [Candidatus Dormibacteria bacterium]
MRTNFNFCPACGARLEPRPVEGRLRPACPRCEFIAFTGPQVATALLATDPRGRVLALRRGIPPGLGGWAFPGGYVDDDEDPAQGAARECREETGCEAEVEGLAGAFHVRTEDGPLVVLAFGGRLTSGQPSTSPEALEVGCFAPEELPELVFSSHRQALQAWRSGRGRREA